MKGSHIGIFALAFLTLLLTVPSAFAQETGIPNADSDAQASFDLMEKITAGQTELANLEALIVDNNFIVDLSGYADAFEEAAGLVATGDYAAAQLVLDNAEIVHDDIYDQFYEQIEAQQDARFDEYVETAKSSLSFIINNGPALGLTQPVIDQLATTLAIIEYGTDGEIEVATGGNSQIGITLSVLPNDLSLPSSFTTGNGLGEELKSKLPPGIAKKYGYSTDSDLGTQSTDVTDDNNGDSLVPGFGAAGVNPSDNPSDIAQATGVGLDGTLPWSPDDWFAGFAFDNWVSPFGDDFDPGTKGREIAKVKAEAGLAEAKLRSEGHGKADPGIPEPPEPPGGPPCGSPPCGGPP